MILVYFLSPPYASKGLYHQGAIYHAIVPQGIIESWAPLYPVFKVIPIALILCIIFLKNKVTRVFSIYVAISYVLLAILQNIVLTEEFGLAIAPGNLIMFLIVAVFWIWEARVGENDFTAIRRPIWKYWVVPLAFLAFWYPLNPDTMKPDFNPLYILTSSAGLRFSMMTAAYLAVLILFYPRVNKTVMGVTSLAGILIGSHNMGWSFWVEPTLLWWHGVLHIPLLSTSIYSLALSLKKRPTEAMEGAMEMDRHI